MSTSAPVMDPLQQQQPPPMEMAQQAYRAHSGHGSVGPVIGVLAVITILGAIAVMIGRLCSGRGIRGHGRYDFEGWVETKCASCIDGKADPPPPPRVVVEHRVRSSSSGDGAEGWVGTKCASCIDGRADPPSPPRVVVEHRVRSSSSGDGVVTAPPEERDAEGNEHHRQHEESTIS